MLGHARGKIRMQIKNAKHRYTGDASQTLQQHTFHIEQTLRHHRAVKHEVNGLISPRLRVNAQFLPKRVHHLVRDHGGRLRAVIDRRNDLPAKLLRGGQNAAQRRTVATAVQHLISSPDLKIPQTGQSIQKRVSLMKQAGDEDAR